MKHVNVKGKLMISILAVLMIAMFSSELQAQRGMGRMKNAGMMKERGPVCMNLPDLSDDQMEGIQKVKTAFLKEIMPIENELDIRQAELKALNAGDKVDLNAVNKKIDEISVLEAKIMKKHAAHRQEIRKLLNDEQKIIFDQKGSRFGRGMKGGFDQARERPGRFRGTHPDCPYRDREESED